MKAKAFLIISIAFTLLAFPQLIRADVITFVGILGDGVTPTVEGDFFYEAYSGRLYRDSVGNGDSYDMEGSAQGYQGIYGGVLSVVRNDLAGGLFTFDGSDVLFQFDQAYAIIFEGYLNGAFLASDSFLTPDNSTWATYASVNLSGILIDELRVTLDATPITATNIDNLVLTPSEIPEPGTLLLLGTGLGTLALAAWRRRK
ncbi:MAG: PEP-CTERM sorting domain-containing protein [Acidobacteria bacterium]|nr:PEP-CTERM sorting domain-containing protein [Acidobacteriota bacterium]